MPATIKVNCPKLNNGYNIKIRRGLIERLGIEILRLNEEKDCEILLISDEKVSSIYLQKVIFNFHECPKPDDIKLRFCELFIEATADSGNFEKVSDLLENMAELGLSENCIVAALGGSVVCGMAAFSAAAYKGGVRLVLVPTTLTAMINFSLSGNAFLDLRTGKNPAEISYSPSLVLYDIDCLKTLPPNEYEADISRSLEILKKNKNPEIIKFFERGGISDNIEKIIESCIKTRLKVS